MCEVNNSLSDKFTRLMSPQTEFGPGAGTNMRTSFNPVDDGSTEGMGGLFTPHGQKHTLIPGNLFSSLESKQTFNNNDIGTMSPGQATMPMGRGGKS